MNFATHITLLSDTKRRRHRLRFGDTVRSMRSGDFVGDFVGDCVVDGDVGGDFVGDA